MVRGDPVGISNVSEVIGASYRNGAPGRTRTGTPLSRQRILSPQHRPISTPGQADNGNTLTNARGGVTVPVHKVRCTAAKVLIALINGSEASSREPALDPRRISLPL